MSEDFGPVAGLVLRGSGQLQLEVFPYPVLRGQDATLRVEATGLCGSDLARYNGSRGELPPMILGHEIAGTIEMILPEASDRWQVQAGDRVVVEEALPCGVCRYCASGRHRLCTNSGLRFGATSVDVAPALWGGFAEVLYLHPWSRVHRVPDGVSADHATLYIPLSNAYGWLVDSGEFRAGEHVVVLGSGLHGICTAIVATKLGAGSVTLVGRQGDQRRLAYATTQGVRTLDCGSGPETVDQIRESLGEGADVVVDLVPGPQQGIADDIALVRRGGRVVVAGVKTQDTAVTVPSLDFLSKEITVRGVWARPDWAVAWSLELLAREEALSDLVEAAHSLGEVEEALLAMQGGDRRPLHSVVNPSDGR